MENEPGFPRPLLEYNGTSHPELLGKPMPLPWLASDGPETGVWAQVDFIRAENSEVNKLCIVCGEQLDADYIFMLFMGHKYSAEFNPMAGLFGDPPSPTWTHLKCGILAATYCPHFKVGETPVACDKDGVQGYTLAQLKELARERRLARSS